MKHVLGIWFLCFGVTAMAQDFSATNTFQDCARTRAGCPEGPGIVKTVFGPFADLLVQKLPLVEQQSKPPFSLSEQYGAAIVSESGFTIVSCTQTIARVVYNVCTFAESDASGLFVVVSPLEFLGLLAQN